VGVTWGAKAHHLRAKVPQQAMAGLQVRGDTRLRPAYQIIGVGIAVVGELMPIRQRLSEQGRTATTNFQVTRQVATDDEEGRAHAKLGEQIEIAGQTTLDDDALLL
jgi:hypothetical protein